MWLQVLIISESKQYFKPCEDLKGETCAWFKITKKSTRNTTNNEHIDAECESVDKIEILETIYDSKNDNLSDS